MKRSTAVRTIILMTIFRGVYPVEAARPARVRAPAASRACAEVYADNMTLAPERKTMLDQFDLRTRIHTPAEIAQLSQSDLLYMAQKAMALGFTPGQNHNPGYAHHNLNMLSRALQDKGYDFSQPPANFDTHLTNQMKALAKAEQTNLISQRMWPYHKSGLLLLQYMKSQPAAVKRQITTALKHAIEQNLGTTYSQDVKDL